METDKLTGRVAHDNYVRPSVEVVSVAVERGFSLSNNQEPSPWEDM